MGSETRPSASWRQVGPWLVASVAYVLGVVGLWIALPNEPLLDLLYRGLQLFVLDGGALQDVGQRPVPLEVARFLAPLATVFALLVALRGTLDEEVRRRQIARTTDHAIVCGDGLAARVLARHLLDDNDETGEDRKVVLVGTPHPGMDDGLLVVPGDARELGTLRAAGVAGARTLYACDESSAVNAAVALSATRLRANQSARLAAFAQVRSDDLVDALRVRRLAVTPPPAVTLDFFNVPDIAARILLARHPVGETTPVVVGSGPVARAVLWAIVRAPGGTPGTVVVAQVPATEVRADAARLGAGNLRWTVRAGDENDGDGPVYVCLPDEDEAIATGLRLARTDTRDVVVCLDRESPFRQALDDDGRLKVFGVLDEACQEKAIEEDSIVGRTARAIHVRYCEEAAARNETVATNPSMAPWADLPPHLKASNIAQAEHIGAKLSELAASLRTVPPEAPFAFRPGEVEQLAQAEHLRWVAERKKAGYEYGPRREGTFHPDMVDWTNLPAVSKEKDRAAVRNLPELLAAEGLYIWRRS
jgi:hypothetical protein